MAEQSSATLRAWWANYRCRPSLMPTVPFPTPSSTIFLPVAREAVPVWAAFSQIMSSEPYYFRESGGGTYNCRPIAGSSAYSLHAYGLAMDLNPKANPQKRPLTYNYPADFIKRVEGIRANGKQAMAWGGRWTGVTPDAMHWQINVSPADCRGTITWDKQTAPPPTGDNLLPLKPTAAQEDIRLLQIKLNQAYELSLPVDGAWGSATATAVKANLVKFTNATDPDILAGKEVNASMWNGLEKDWVIDFTP